MTFTKPFRLSFWEAIKGQITTHLCLVNRRSHTYFVWNGSYNRPGDIAHSLDLFGVLMKHADMKLSVPLRKEKNEHQQFSELTSHCCGTFIKNPCPPQNLKGIWEEKSLTIFFFFFLVRNYASDICEWSSNSFCIICSNCFHCSSINNFNDALLLCQFCKHSISLLW